MNSSHSNRLMPYHYYVQDSFSNFWRNVGNLTGRRFLFIFGLGFDPRCVPALQHMVKLYASLDNGNNAELYTVCLRFTNVFDKCLQENKTYTNECLDAVRAITREVKDPSSRHCELEVNIFPDRKQLTGDRRLVEEFEDAIAPELPHFTDIVVDISAFPRTLMYGLVGRLWKNRSKGQNIIALLSDADFRVDVVESDYTDPSYMLGGREPDAGAKLVWVPVMGGQPERFRKIHNALKPSDILPIVPFPTPDPRSGDETLLKARRDFFDGWGVPFGNVLYASAEIPYSVFRKIREIVDDYSEFDKLELVVSALSGRSVSLGVLLAALHFDLPVYHSQPATYKMDRSGRRRLWDHLESIEPIAYYLDGELYGE